jgi:hypothetical protein
MRFTAKAQQLKIYRTVWNSASSLDGNTETGAVNLQLLIYHMLHMHHLISSFTQKVSQFKKETYINKHLWRGI